jgi:aminoglycoside N3'-acetyltransferase
MNNQLYMPDVEVDQQLLSNLRRSWLDVAELDVKIEDLLNKLEHYSHQQRLNRVK